MEYKVYFCFHVEVNAPTELWARLEAEKILQELKLPHEVKNIEFSEVEENEYYDKDLDLIVKGQREKQ